MKTIKLLVLGLLSTLFLSCSETYDDDVFFEPTIKRIAHHYKQYYEEPIVINTLTNGDDVYGYNFESNSGIINLGYVSFQQRYVRNEVIDTLTIDLNSYYRDIKQLRFTSSISNPNQVENKYATINYLKIIGLDENPDLRIIGDDVFGKIEVYNSNVSIEELNSISGTTNNASYALFEKVDYERKEWSFQTYVLDALPNYAGDNDDFTDGYIGFIGYDNHQRRGLKLEIVDITEHYD